MQKIKDLLNSEAALTAIAAIVASVLVRELGLDPIFTERISTVLLGVFALAVAFGLGNNSFKKKGGEILTLEGARWTAKFLDMIEGRYSLDIPAEIEQEVLEVILGALGDEYVIIQELDKTRIERKPTLG